MRGGNLTALSLKMNERLINNLSNDGCYFITRFYPLHWLTRHCREPCTYKEPRTSTLLQQPRVELPSVCARRHRNSAKTQKTPRWLAWPHRLVTAFRCQTVYRYRQTSAGFRQPRCRNINWLLQTAYDRNELCCAAGSEIAALQPLQIKLLCHWRSHLPGGHDTSSFRWVLLENTPFYLSLQGCMDTYTL